MKKETYEVSELELFLERQNDNFRRKKIIDKEGLKRRFEFLKNTSNHTLTRNYSILLNDEPRDPTTFSSTLDIFHSYQEKGFSGVKTKNTNSKMISDGESPLFRRVARRVSLHKAIDIRSLQWTSALIFPSNQSPGCFAFCKDIGHDSSGRPSNYDRVYFEIPIGIEMSHLVEVLESIFHLHNIEYQPRVSTIDQKFWAHLEKGSQISFNNSQHYLVGIYSAIEIFKQVPSRSWLDKQLILEYNPESIEITNPAPKQVGLDLESLHRFHNRMPLSDYLEKSEAVEILRKENWFRKPPKNNDILATIGEYETRRVDANLATFLAQKHPDYSVQKLLVSFHVEHNRKKISQKGLKSLLEIHNLLIKDQAIKKESDKTLEAYYRNLPRKSCGAEDFENYDLFIELNSNELLATVQSMLCWNKEAKKLISRRDDILNWDAKKQGYEENLSQLRTRLIQEQKSKISMERDRSEKLEFIETLNNAKIGQKSQMEIIENHAAEITSTETAFGKMTNEKSSFSDGNRLSLLRDKEIDNIYATLNPKVGIKDKITSTFLRRKKKQTNISNFNQMALLRWELLDRMHNFRTEKIRIKKDLEETLSKSIRQNGEVGTITAELQSLRSEVQDLYVKIEDTTNKEKSIENQISEFDKKLGRHLRLGNVSNLAKW